MAEDSAACMGNCKVCAGGRIGGCMKVQAVGRPLCAPLDYDHGFWASHVPMLLDCGPLDICACEREREREREEEEVSFYHFSYACESFSCLNYHLDMLSPLGHVVFDCFTVPRDRKQTTESMNSMRLSKEEYLRRGVNPSNSGCACR